MDPAKLKVVELRAELANRGLDQKGVKATLVTRLQAALDEEAAGGVVSGGGGGFSAPVLDNSFNDEPSDGDGSSTGVGGGGGSVVGTPQKVTRRRRTRSMTRSPSPVKTEQDVLQTPLDTLNEEDSDCSPPPRKIPTTPARGTPSRRRHSQRSTTRSPSPNARPEVPTPLAAVAEEEPMAQEDEEQEVIVQTISDETDETEAVNKEDITEDALVEDKKMPEKEGKTIEDNEANAGTIEDSSATAEGNGDKADILDEKKSEDSAEDKPKETSTTSTKSSPSKLPEVNLKKPERSTEPRLVEFTNVEDEPELPESGIYLSWMDSDLHLQIGPKKDFLEARPVHESHMMSAYSGCRATHGVRTGRVAYEVHISNVIHTNQYERPKYDIRVGWSTRSTSLQLGEGPLSFAYTMQRKKALASVFTEYGMLLRTGDVVGVYLDLESEPCRVEYTVNGKTQGMAFEFERSELGDAALYPHVLTKCVAYRCNFSDSVNLLVNTTQPEFTEPDEKNERRMITPKQTRAKKPSDLPKTNATTSNKDKPKVGDDETKEVVTEDAEAKSDDAVATEEADESIAASEDKPEPSDGDKAIPETVEEPAQDEAVPDKAAVIDETPTAEDEPIDKPEEETKEDNAESAPTAEDASAKAATVVEAPVVPRVIYDLLPDYVLIGQVDAELLVAGPVRPAKREECEVIMMIGLPGSGKTTWALNHAKEHEDKNYYLLSQATILERTTFDGKARFAPRSKNWEHSLKYYLRTLDRLYSLAQKRRRNYIIDEPNVTFDEQKKRIKGFGDFNRTAVVVIPSQADLKERSEKKETTDGRTYNRTYLADMKTNFELPDAGCLFHEIKYTELDEAQSADILQEYYKEGQMYKMNKDNSRDRYDPTADKYRQQRGSYPSHQPHWQGGNQPRNHRGGASNYRHSGGGGHQRDDYRSPAPYWRGGGGGGGGNRHYGSGGFDHHRDRWNGGGGGAGGGNRNWVLNNRGGGGGGGHRYEDRGFRGSHQPQHSAASGGYQRRDYNSSGGYNNGGAVGGGTYNNYRGGGGAADRRGNDRSYHGGGGQRDHRDFRDGNRDRHTGDRTKNDRGVPHYNKDDKVTKSYGSTNNWNQSAQQGAEDWSSYYQQHQQPQNYYAQQAGAWQQTPTVADNQQYWSDSSWQQTDTNVAASAVAAGTDQTQQQGWQNWSQYAQTYGNVDPSVAAYKK